MTFNFWTYKEEVAAPGEYFEFFGDRYTKRESCVVCHATGTDYGETCVKCGGEGWTPVEESKVGVD